MGERILEILGGLTLVGAGGAAVAGVIWMLCRKALENWISNYFDIRKRNFEHSQAKELQKLKSRIDTLFQGALKLQDREFRVIPEALEKVGDALGVAMWLCSPMQEVSLVREMNAEDLDEFLELQQDMLEGNKRRIRESIGDSRQRLWERIELRMKVSRARRALAEADKYIKTQGIFMPVELLEQFESLINVIWIAISQFQIAGENSAYRTMNEAWTKLKDEGEPAFKALGMAARERLNVQAKGPDVEM